MNIFKFMFYSGLIFSGLGVMSEDDEIKKYYKEVIKKMEPKFLDLLKKADHFLSDIENVNAEKTEMVSKYKYNELKKMFDDIDEEKIKELGLSAINKFKNKLSDAERNIKKESKKAVKKKAKKKVKNKKTSTK